jgi:hypothetical protein
MRAFVLGLAFVVSFSACDYILQPTKTGKGELYQSGNGKYDPYFATVHQEQAAAKNWPDEAKASRKPIVSALNVMPDASNTTILRSTRDKKGDSALAGPIEQTTLSEIDRAHRLASAAAKLDDLLKQGEELKRQTAEDRKNLGSDKADEHKREKADEVKHEMAAAVDAVDTMSSKAHKGAKEAEELAIKLKAAWTGKSEDERPIPAAEEKKEEKKEDEKKEEKKEDKTKPAAKKPAPPPAAKKPPPAQKPAEPPPAPKPPEEKPAPKPAPTQQPADEVFNP